MPALDDVLPLLRCPHCGAGSAGGKRATACAATTATPSTSPAGLPQPARRGGHPTQGTPPRWWPPGSASWAPGASIGRSARRGGRRGGGWRSRLHRRPRRRHRLVPHAPARCAARGDRSRARSLEARPAPRRSRPSAPRGRRLRRLAAASAAGRRGRRRPQRVRPAQRGRDRTRARPRGRRGGCHPSPTTCVSSPSRWDCSRSTRTRRPGSPIGSTRRWRSPTAVSSPGRCAWTAAGARDAAAMGPSAFHVSPASTSASRPCLSCSSPRPSRSRWPQPRRRVLGLQLQQQALPRQTASVPHQRPVRPDHPVTRDDHRDRIAPVRRPHRAPRPGVPAPRRSRRSSRSRRTGSASAPPRRRAGTPTPPGPAASNSVSSPAK